LVVHVDVIKVLSNYLGDLEHWSDFFASQLIPI